MMRGGPQHPGEHHQSRAVHDTVSRPVPLFAMHAERPLQL